MDQDYYFTAGGIVLEQYGMEVMSASPNIRIDDTSSGPRLELFLYGITSDFYRISGIESLPVSIRLAGTSQIDEAITAPDVVSLRINGEGEMAWSDQLTSILVESGMVEGIDFTVTLPADWDDPLDQVEIDIGNLASVYAKIGEMEVNI